MNLENIFDKNIDVDNRTIFFCPWHDTEIKGDDEDNTKDNNWIVSDATIQAIFKGLYYLDKLNHGVITIIWNSDGGEWSSGMALYDLIKEIKSPIIMKCYGRVRSMGTIILQACVERLLSPNCEFMIHYGDAKITGESRCVVADAVEEKKCNEKMEQIYLEKINIKQHMTLKEFKESIFCNTWLNPEEAIKLNLADGIIGDRE